MNWTLTLGLLVLLVDVLVVLRCINGNRQIAMLDDIEPIGDKESPRMAIVVAARNEERHMLVALRSMLDLDYPHLTIVAVDDRSTDRTGQILDELAEADCRLHAMHVTDLPEGWIGKNHAMHQGASRVDADLILFTDADVRFAPDSIRRAVAYFHQHDLDHLVVTPRIIAPGVLLKGFVISFTAMFGAYFTPWKARDPNSSSYVGIGAFNLLRAEVYQRLGGHEKIRMRPDDDLKLGKLIKQNGLRQDIVDGCGRISVPWYNSLSESIVGLEKNAFSGVDYSIAMIVFSTMAVLVTIVWPFFAVFVTASWTRLIYGLACLVLLAWGCKTASSSGYRWRYGLLLPVFVTILNVVQWRAMILTYCRGGIRWRDTHYSLAELRDNKL